MANFTFQRADGTLTSVSAFDEAEARSFAFEDPDMGTFLGAGMPQQYQSATPFNTASTASLATVPPVPPPSEYDNWSFDEFKEGGRQIGGAIAGAADWLGGLFTGDGNQNADRMGTAGYNWTEDIVGQLKQPGSYTYPGWGVRAGDPYGRQNPEAFAPSRQQAQRELMGTFDEGGWAPSSTGQSTPVDGAWISPYITSKGAGVDAEAGGAEEMFQINPDYDKITFGPTSQTYNVVAQGATNATPIGKAVGNLATGSAISDAYKDPNPQNGISVMLDLLDDPTLDEGSREALLLNIGNLYTAMQTSNPFGFDQPYWEGQAALDRASQETQARGGLSAEGLTRQQMLDRESQQMIARGGLSQGEASWQRGLDEQYRQGQLSNEEAAIAANRYGSEEAARGQIQAAYRTAGGVKAAATSAANAARDVASSQAGASMYGAAQQAGASMYGTDAAFYSQMHTNASQERLSKLANTSAEAISYFQNEAAKSVAATNNLSAAVVAEINAGGAERVAIQQGWSAEKIADLQKQMNIQVASLANLTEVQVANAMAQAQRDVAETQAGATTTAATTAADAAKAVAGTRAGATTGAADIMAGAQTTSAASAAGAVTTAAASAAGAQTTSATTQADAAKLIATTNKESAKAVAVQAGLNEKNVADIMAQVQKDLAAVNNISAADVAEIMATSAVDVAQKTGLSQEDIAEIQAESAKQVATLTGLNEASVATIMANAQTSAATTAANPFGLSTQQFMDIQGTQARGGLSVEERLAEISAANEPERLAALLGALAPGVQGSLQGFGMTAPPTVPTISNIRNTSAERQQYIEGLFGSFGVSPSALVNLIKSVTPGSPFGASTFA